MSDTSANNKRIAKNTAILYVRMVILMAINLYTSRIVLEKLGVEDYGIYNAVAGFISMFALMTNSLTAAISRFLTFELGKLSVADEREGICKRLRETFSTSIIIQVIIGLIIIVLSESFGIYFLNSEMNIPESRMTAANWVFQISLITFFINMISIPYNAIIIAHEKMSVFAYIGLFQGFSTLFIAFLIDAFPLDSLITYSGLLCMLSIIIRLQYGMYCNHNFEESRFSCVFRKDLLKEIFGFAGWNFIGASSGVLRSQGVNVLMNIYCGPVVNAARGLSVQVNSAVQQFSGNFTTALNPQITKHYATGDTNYSISLVFQGARFSLYLYSFLAIPIITETDTILNLWLHEVPEHTIAFIRLVMIYSMIESLSGTMTTLMLTTGNIRNYQLLVGGLQLLHFPAAWIVLAAGLEPELTYFCAMGVALCCLVARLYMLHKMVNLPVKQYFKNVFLNILIVVTVAIIPPFAVKYIMTEGFIRLCVVTIVSFTALAASIYYIGCTSKERMMVAAKLSMITNKILNR